MSCLLARADHLRPTQQERHQKLSTLPARLLAVPLARCLISECYLHRPQSTLHYPMRSGSTVGSSICSAGHFHSQWCSDSCYVDVEDTAECRSPARPFCSRRRKLSLSPTRVMSVDDWISSSAPAVIQVCQSMSQVSKMTMRCYWQGRVYCPVGERWIAVSATVSTRARRYSAETGSVIVGDWSRYRIILLLETMAPGGQSLIARPVMSERAA